MVYYFVIGADGNRYGPADIDALVQWTREGRIIGSTMLVERGTERQMRADAITAIAVALQRQSAGPAGVAVERSEFDHREAPTMTQAPRAAPPPPPPANDGLAPLAAQRRVVSPKSRVVAGLLGIFLGALGLHRFYLGYTGIGIVMLLATVLTSRHTLGLSCGIVALWGFVEGIICLSGGMSDAEGRPLE